MSPRIPGTRTRSEWVLRPNPAYEGREPTPLKAECHDGTPFITVVCECGEEMHLHESQTARVPEDVEVASRCRRCRRLLVFPPRYFADAFARLREEGWIE